MVQETGTITDTIRTVGIIQSNLVFIAVIGLITIIVRISIIPLLIHTGMMSGILITEGGIGGDLVGRAGGEEGADIREGDSLKMRD